MNHRIEARVIVFNEAEEMLLIEQVPGWWIPPGGGGEKGETPTQAAIREVREESGIDVEIVKLLWCTEAYDAEYDQLNLGYVFLGHVIGGQLSSDEHCASFFPRSEFANLGVHKHVSWPDGIFWQLLKTDLADYDPMGPRLLHKSG